MTDSAQYCPRCCLWHPLPWCDHDMTARCMTCSNARGPRWNDDNGKPHSPAWQCPACARKAEQARGATAA